MCVVTDLRCPYKIIADIYFGPSAIECPMVSVTQASECPVVIECPINPNFSQMSVSAGLASGCGCSALGADFQTDSESPMKA